MKRTLSLTLVVLMIMSALMFTATASAKFEWDFNKDGDMEGWTLHNATGGVSGGSITAQAIANSDNLFDPIVSLSDLDLDANTYGYIQVGMKHDLVTTGSAFIQLYFKSSDHDLSEDTSIRISTPQTSDGKFVDYLFDTSENDMWTGKITYVRIDPFNGEGTFSIDYIKFLEEAPDAPEPSEPEEPEEPEKDIFPEVNTYSPDIFDDVSQEEWYYKEVATAYKIGLMNGKAEKVFDPEGTVKVCEAITLAVRVNEIYNGRTGQLELGDPWYQPYVDAAADAGIIDQDQFDDYEALISRADMGVLFAKALPDDYYTPINSFTTIPDIAGAQPYFNDILKLYNAGIITGMDDEGTYNPDANIKRSEVSAIITRVAIKSSRVRKMTAEEIKAEEEKAAAEKAAAEKAAADRAAAEKAAAEKVSAETRLPGVALVNGDAEDTGNIAFFSDNANITIVEDPDEPGNYVYLVNPKQGKNWTYFRKNVTFVAGKTYIAEFDIKVVGTNDGSDKADQTSINFNFIYDDVNKEGEYTNKVDHSYEGAKVGTEDGWVHIKKEIKVAETSTSRMTDQFSFYANPIEELSVVYMVDNVSLVEK